MHDTEMDEMLNSACIDKNEMHGTETKNKLLLQMKAALFTNLRYYFPLVKGSVCVMTPSKATNGQTA